MKHIYERYKITLTDMNETYLCEHITSIDEYDHDIVVQTIVPIEEIKRGWIGNLTCHLSGCSIENPDNKVNSHVSFKDVLCAKITITADDRIVTWKYTFLKD